MVLESTCRIDLPPEVEIEFVLLDNDPAGVAREVFEAYANAFPFQSHYFVESNQRLVCTHHCVVEDALSLGATEVASLTTTRLSWEIG
jgi:hypothetical protein